MHDTTRKPARIVVIEDNPGDVHLFREAFDQVGEPYQLEVLSDGAAALRFLEDQRRREDEEPDPCLIVLDVQLPKYDGIAVLTAIRQDPNLSHLKVAVVSTITSPQQEAEILRLGVHLLRRKPISLEEFLDLGRELIALCHEHATRVAFTS